MEELYSNNIYVSYTSTRVKRDIDVSGLSFYFSFPFIFFWVPRTVTCKKHNEYFNDCYNSFPKFH